MPIVHKISADFDRVLCDDFLGLNAVYHGFNHMPEYALRGYTDADRDVEYERVGEARLRIARTMFTPMMNCLDIYGPYDMKCQRMEAMRRWCEDMKELGVDVALQTGWHFSRNTYWGHDGPNEKTDPEAFADWAAASFGYLMDECGLDNIKYAVLFTEPTSYQSGDLPEGWSMWDYYVRVCRAIDKRFREAGLRDRLQFIGPNNTSGGVNIAEAVRDLPDVIDIFSGHDYNFVHQGQWAAMAKRMAAVAAPTGKRFWMDEYGVQLEPFRMSPEYGGFIAQIICASTAAGHQTTTIWTLLDQLHCGGAPMGIPEGETDDGSHSYNGDSFHDGIHRWGVASFPRDDFEGAGGVYPAWYAFVLLNKALGGRQDGGKVKTVATSDALTVCTCAAEQDGERAFVAVNRNGYDAEVEIAGLPEGKLWRHVYAPGSRFPAFGTAQAPVPVECAGGIVRDTLPASGFAVYSTREVL